MPSSVRYCSISSEMRDQLGALEQVDHVAQGDDVLDLEGGQVGRDLVQAGLVPLEGLEGLVAATEDRRDGLQLVALVLGVDGHHGHVLGDRDDRDADGSGDTLGRAVPGAGLLGRDVRVGHQVHVRPGDVAGIGREHDGTVGLGQLGQALGRERHGDQEAAGGDVEHLRAVTDDDERAHARLQDAVQALSQRSPGGHRGKGAQELLAVPLGHDRTPAGAVRGGNVWRSDVDRRNIDTV